MKRSKEYREMMTQHGNKLVEIAKDCKPWDYGWSLDFLIEHLEFMRDYYTLGENVVAREDCEWKEGEVFTRLEKINFILEAYEEWRDFHLQPGVAIEEETDRYLKIKELFFSLLNKYIESLWD